MRHTDKIATEPARALVREHLKASASLLISELRKLEECESAFPELESITGRQNWNWAEIDAEFPTTFDDFSESEKITWAERNNIEPDWNEALEHWLVSDWLATSLRAKGEMITEICGLWVWGRTTTGQAVWMDSVIQEVALERENPRIATRE